MVTLSKSTATNKSICKSRAEQCNISYVQALAAVRADEFQFSFLLLTSTLYFQLGICTGQDKQCFPYLRKYSTLFYYLHIPPITNIHHWLSSQGTYFVGIRCALTFQKANMVITKIYQVFFLISAENISLGYCLSKFKRTLPARLTRPLSTLPTKITFLLLPMALRSYRRHLKMTAAINPLPATDTG